jgi:hypothetical protein
MTNPGQYLRTNATASVSPEIKEQQSRLYSYAVNESRLAFEQAVRDDPNRPGTPLELEPPNTAAIPYDSSIHFTFLPPLLTPGIRVPKLGALNLMIFNDELASTLSVSGKLLIEVSEGMRQQVDRESNEPYSDEQLSLIEAVGFAFDAKHAQVCSSGNCQRTQGIQWCEGCPAEHYYCPDCASGELACIRRCCYKCLQ